MAAEDQGIMSLPQGAGTEAPAPLSLEDSYDAVQTGLSTASPQASADIQELMRSITPALDQLSDEDLQKMLEIVQYLYEGGEAEYAKRRQEAISSGAIEQDDLPEDFDPEVLSAIGTVVMQALQQRQGGTQQEMPAPPAQFARGGIAEAARLVASRGRDGDTMLAHINPKEARLLRSHGGSGTINPKTGLPEYKNIFQKIGGAIKSAFKSVVNAVKPILKSPIGRILATVALATFLGPVAGAFAAPLAAGTVTLAGGGNIKQALVAGATAYFGAPGGAVAEYVGAAGITNVAANAAVTAGIVGTGAGLLSGQKLADAVKSGLTAGATSGLMAGMKSGFGTTTPTGLPPGSMSPQSVQDAARPVTPESVSTQIEGGTQTAPVAPPPAPVAPPAPPVLTSPVAPPNPVMPEPLGPVSQGVTADQIMGPYVEPPMINMAAQGTGAPYSPTAGLQLPPGAAPEAGYTVAGAPTGTPTAGDSFQRMAGGIGDLMQGKEGAFDTVKQGASDLFFPKTMSAAELQNTEAFQNARANGASYSEAMKAASANNPGLLRQYGPLAAAGVGVMGLAGGFTPGAPPKPTLVPSARGQDLINQDPSRYMIQGLPGVQYSAQGNITGSSSWSPFASMADVRAPAYDYLNPRRAAYGGIASLATGGYPRKTGAISGPGTETSDSIPAMLSDGEFVMTAKAVKAMGNGSRRAGAKKMYALMHQLERNASRG